MLSPTVALLLVLAFQSEPSLMDRGVLFKNDLAATLGYLLFLFRA